MKHLLALVLAVLTTDAIACSCVTPKYPVENDYLNALESAQAVFVGFVESIERIDAYDSVSLTVTESFKGQPIGRASVSTQSTGSVGSYGYPFAVGKTYLVYAWPDGHGGLVATHCSFTKRYKPRSREIRILRKGR